MSDSGVELYLKEISRYQLLTIEEELGLARRVRQGDQEARNEMVRANLRLVVSIAKNYVDRGLSLLDLIEEGNIGLLKAVERFNPDEGCKFSTYASWWIKQTVRRALINKVKNVRVPAYMVELLTRWRRSNEKLTQRLGRQPTAEEIADDVGLSTDKLPTLHRAIYAHGVGRRGEAASFIQDIEDESAVAPGGDDTMVDRTDGHTLDQMLGAALSEREDLILRMRFGVGTANRDFGLAEGAVATLDQIGKRIGLTRERVRQIEAQALNKLFCFLTGAQLPAAQRRLSQTASARSGRRRGPDGAARSGRRRGPDGAARSGRRRGPDGAARSGRRRDPDGVARGREESRRGGPDEAPPGEAVSRSRSKDAAKRKPAKGKVKRRSKKGTTEQKRSRSKRARSGGNPGPHGAVRRGSHEKRRTGR